MVQKTASRLVRSVVLVCILLLIMSFAEVPSGVAQTSRIPGDSKLPMKLTGTTTSLVVEELSASLYPEDMAVHLIGEGVTISNVTYNGANIAAGAFYGGDGVVGFESGILLTSGSVHNVVGPNTSDSISTDNLGPGDPDLDALSGYPTYDASILQFEFVPDVDTVFFRYVFASDEYNEFVNSSFNDVFAFYVNGENCATVEGDAVSINHINYGDPYETEPYSHPECYINNDVSDGGGQLDTEMDGLTHVLTCWASVSAGETNTLKLAIADASDHVWDSAVFLEAGSLTSESVIELTGLEVTQAIQNLENDDVTLIESKPTYVRAHVRSISGTVYNAKVRLIGRRDGDPLPGSPLAPADIGGNIDVREYPMRLQLNHSFYFEIPATWLNGTVEFELVEVGQTIECKDHAGADDDCKVEVSFVETPDPEVRLVGIPWTDGDGVLHDPNVGDYAAVVQDIEAQYPIDNLDWDSPYELEYALQGSPPLWLILLRLGEQRLLDGCVSAWPVSCERIYFGLLVDPAGSDLGLALLNGSVSAGYYESSDPTTAAHEIGHNLGRSHTNCAGSESDPDPDYPYADGQISEINSGDGAYYGFHISTRRILPPYTGDLMGYCVPAWVSDHTYNHLQTAIADRFSDSMATASPRLLSAAGEPAVLVSGYVILEEELGSLQSVLRVESPTPVAPPESGPYMIAFADIEGDLLGEYSFVVDAPEDTDEPVGTFSLLLPWHDNTHEIIFKQGETLIDTRVASHTAPQIAVTSPSGGDVWSGESATIAWTANDDDGDELEYTVQYSTDAGTTWLTLVTGVQATSSYHVTLDNLPGSEQALVRVLATDGFHTASDQSDGTFVVEGHAPTAEIELPGTDSLYVEDQMIIFRGSAYDAEDGQLDDASLNWVSDLDGPLGTGQSPAVNASSLTPGTHIITLMAEDSDGQVDMATIMILVYRDRPTLPRSLSVAPDHAAFSVIEGISTTLTLEAGVSNDGDGTIVWSASTDRDWLSISQSEGFSPANVLLEVSTSGLPAGVFTGTITITGTDSLDSPQTIDVTLSVHEAVHADFLADLVSGVAPLDVEFTNLSTGKFHTCTWDFGDGTTSDDCNDPLHSYNSAGVHSVVVTASGLGGTDTLTRTDYVIVYEASHASFTGTPTDGAPPLTVVFTSTSSGDYTSSLWDFGDGQTSTEQDPTHVYTSPGTYTVSLEVDGLGGSNSVIREDYIVVENHMIYLPLTMRVP